ncbi:multi-sensor signal transduction histidine kinase [Caballeronia temeraria]|uniref:Multi-sensor signal transduction histidine kinase n=1 Tax=Caballeronia temeraria TaxID=1777137 RepID=A0A158AS42_9BURK|nr:PAS domain-containing sensor histidine kinase [Caballeronia temeraria]SAK60470.1 multi-sensor signal transduction histidine kinase [Caballeronia temeraria]
MNEHEGRHPALSDSPGDRHAPSRVSIAQAILAGAALLGVWWAGMQYLPTICPPGLAARRWVLAAAATCALLLAGLLLLRATHRARPATIGQTAMSHARLDGIIRSTTDAIITIDAAQRILLFNPMAERVFGCAASEAIGGPLSRFIPERYRAAHEHQVRQFGSTGVSDRRMGPQRVLYGLRADGEEFPIEASISHDGKLFTVILRDVTERVKAEAELRQSREELRALSANLQQLREQEKRRIARELHDDLGQTLSALKMNVFALHAQLGTHTLLNDGVATQLQRMVGLIDRNIASLRRIAAHQRPVMLDDLGLAAAVDWLVGDFIQRYGIDVKHSLDTGDLVFDSDAATAVFRIIEEALTNVVRHAHASRVDLSLSAGDHHCVLRVGDNGIGASALPAAGNKPFGLLGVRERANALGGRVFIDSMPENGFVLTVVLPRETVRDKESRP